jgi:hydroxyacylglutathione hydrolase
MIKTLKRVMIGIGLMVALIGILFVGYFLKAKSELKKMTPTETQQIDVNIFSIRDTFVNMYLVRDGDQYVAIDAGNNADNIEYELKKLKISTSQITAVLLTHTDKDHVAGIKLFNKAKVYLSAPEKHLLNGDKSRFLFFGNTIARRDYTLIEDQELLKIGNIPVKGILTPGHTIGSMCYLINDKYLFTGDAISLKDGVADKFNTFFNMDTKTALASMKKLANIPTAEYILTAHYGYTSNYKKAVKDWVN